MHYPNAVTLRRVASALANVPRFPSFLDQCFSMIVLRAAEGNMSFDVSVCELTSRELKDVKQILTNLGYKVSTKRLPMIVGNGMDLVLCISWAANNPEKD